MPTSNYEKRANQVLSSIEVSSTINQSNKRKLFEFHRSLLLAGIGAPRRQKLFSHLKIIAEYLGPSRFEDVEKADVEDLVEWIYMRGLRGSTIQDYKQIIKQFWRWMNNGENPEATAWIRRRSQPPLRILPQSLLTPEDVQRLIGVCSNDRDQAFIAMLWETGARIGELIDLKVGEIEHGTTGKYIIVSGKTGSRRLPLSESTLYLDQWLSVHPLPEIDAPLWCKIEYDPSEGIGYNYIRLRLLERARKRAGIEKPINPHHLDIVEQPISQIG